MPALKTTAMVIEHHIKALLTGDLDEVIKDYNKDSILFTPSGTYKGPDQIKAAFKAVLTLLTPEIAANMKTIRQDIQGDFAYGIWMAPPAVPFGGDTFLVRNGVILMQSFVGKI